MKTLRVRLATVVAMTREDETEDAEDEPIDPEVLRRSVAAHVEGLSYTEVGTLTHWVGHSPGFPLCSSGTVYLKTAGSVQNRELYQRYGAVWNPSQ